MKINITYYTNNGNIKILQNHINYLEFYDNGNIYSNINNKTIKSAVYTRNGQIKITFRHNISYTFYTYKNNGKIKKIEKVYNLNTFDYVNPIIIKYSTNGGITAQFYNIYGNIISYKNLNRFLKKEYPEIYQKKLKKEALTIFN